MSARGLVARSEGGRIISYTPRGQLSVPYSLPRGCTESQRRSDLQMQAMSLETNAARLPRVSLADEALSPHASDQLVPVTVSEVGSAVDPSAALVGVGPLAGPDRLFQPLLLVLQQLAVSLHAERRLEAGFAMAFALWASVRLAALSLPVSAPASVPRLQSQRPEAVRWYLLGVREQRRLDRSASMRWILAGAALRQ